AKLGELEDGAKDKEKRQLQAARARLLLLTGQKDKAAEIIALVWGAADLATRARVRVSTVVAVAALLLGVWLPLGLWRAAGAGAEMMEDRLLFLAPAVLSAVAV